MLVVSKLLKQGICINTYFGWKEQYVVGLYYMKLGCAFFRKRIVLIK